MKMNCHRVQNLLSAYLDQELTAEERRVIRQHLFSCRSCSLEYETLSLIKSSLGGLEPPKQQKNFLSKIARAHALIHNGSTSFPTSSGAMINSFVLGKKVLMTAACLLLFMVTSVWLFPTPQSSNSTANSGQIIKNNTRAQSETIENQIYTLKTKESADKKDKKEKPVNPHYPLIMGIPVSH